MIDVDFEKLNEIYEFQMKIRYNQMAHQTISIYGLESVLAQASKSYLNDNGIEGPDKVSFLILHKESLDNAKESHRDLMSKKSLSPEDIDRFKKSFFESFKNLHEEKMMADQSGPKRKIF